MNDSVRDATQAAGTARWPAEWEPHERTLISWPVADALVFPDNLDEVCAGYAAVVGAVSAFEPVTLLVNEDDLPRAAAMCGGDAEYLVIPHDDAWLRDNGPTFVRLTDGTLQGVAWRFNAWGGKYPHALDERVPAAVLKHLGVPCDTASIVLEGGSIHSDGQGTILTTEQCLLHPSRNPGLGKADIEDALRRHLWAKAFLWLPEGLDGDHTDGHVDNVACFAAPGVVLLQVCDDVTDPNHAVAARNREALACARDAAGRTLKVIEIPQPPMRHYEGMRLTLSYLNFYLVNGGVIAPVFGGDARLADEAALKALAAAFPDRQVVPVDGMALVKEGGNVHCITQQMPLNSQPSKGM